MKDQYINPFDDEKHQFLVLINTQHQYSLWPNFAPVPPGWTAVYGPEIKAQCSQYIDQHWSDIRS